MARSNPPAPPEQLIPRKDREMITEIREYQLITPLFGGGVEPNTPDPVTTIRATEIRGHLRFWWRATRGGQFKTIEELKAKEDEIWGAAAKFDQNGKPYGASQISLSILQASWDIKKKTKAYKIRQNKNGKWRAYAEQSIAPEYASFPLKPEDKKVRESKQNTPIADIYPDVTFIMKISYLEENKNDVEAALWAWETFGGVGARTRRGFGAISPVKKPQINNLIEYIRNGIEKYVYPNTRLNLCPCLSIDLSDYKVVFNKDSKVNNISFENIQKAWDKLIISLQIFRQQRDDPQSTTPNMPGRSKWPEPDSIRIQTGNWASYHIPRTQFNKYPRAVFGLPIVTKFKDDDMRNGDPSQVTLYGVEGINRLASPLFLRPFVYQSDNKTHYVGLAFVLNTLVQPLGGLTLEIDKRRYPVNSEPLTPKEVKHLISNGLDLPNNNSDVLRAFLAYLEQE